MHILKISFFILFLFPAFVFAQYDFPEWEADVYKAANTGEVALYLSEQEKEVIKYLNYVRMNGKLFAETYVKKYAEINGKTNLKQVKSLIIDLNKTKPLEPYRPDEGLTKSAKKHAEYMGKQGKLGHIGKGGKNPAERIEEFVKWDIWVAENIQYGAKTPLDMVMHLLIDEKVPDLGHRKNILEPRGRYIGVSIAPHKTFSVNCVMELTGGIK